MEARTIKFRAKRKLNGNWVYGSYVKGATEDSCLIIEEIDDDIGQSDYTRVITKTVGQFTGLLDKNGKEIYEGDILRLSDGDVSHHRIYFDQKAGRWMDERLEDGDSLTGYDEFGFVTDCKVIGNVLENPELTLK